MPRDEEAVREKRNAFYWSLGASFCYLLLLPLLFYMVMASSVVFDNPSISVSAGYAMMTLALFFPLAIPFSIFAIWMNYQRGDYRRLRFYCLLPIVLLGCFVVIYYVAAFAGHLFVYVFSP